MLLAARRKKRFQPGDLNQCRITRGVCAPSNNPTTNRRPHPPRNAERSGKKKKKGNTTRPEEINFISIDGPTRAKGPYKFLVTKLSPQRSPYKPRQRRPDRENRSQVTTKSSATRCQLGELKEWKPQAKCQSMETFVTQYHNRKFYYH